MMSCWSSRISESVSKPCSLYCMSLRRIDLGNPMSLKYELHSPKKECALHAPKGFKYVWERVLSTPQDPGPCFHGGIWTLISYLSSPTSLSTETAWRLHSHLGQLQRRPLVGGLHVCHGSGGKALWPSSRIVVGRSWAEKPKGSRGPTATYMFSQILFQ